jgi:hypothetical protein
MSENTQSIQGSGNVGVQDVTVGGNLSIVINHQGELTPEVSAKKEELQKSLNDLSGHLKQIQGNVKPYLTSTEFEEPDDENYSKIKWRRLRQALQRKGCILFIGPEISVDADGNSLHKNFYTELAEDFDDIEYLEKEGFFSPGADEAIKYDVMDYYEKDFHRENKTGRKLLERLAQIPFELIISLCPDDTMHSIYDEFSIPHEFLAFDGTKQEIETGEENNPVIYNILGLAAKNGNYIFTHENFYQYLSKVNGVSIPARIRDQVKEATHFIFLGFDLDKWYNRLLLFILDLKEKKSGDLRLIIGDKEMKDDVEKFIEKQFDITFVNNDYAKFTEWLEGNAIITEDVLRDLYLSFIPNTEKALHNISLEALKILSKDISDDQKISDDEKVKSLLKLIDKAKNIGGRIEKFNKRISN